MRFLFLCNKSPWPAHEGGPIAMNSLIQGLLDEGHTIKILAVNSNKYKVKDKDIPSDFRDATAIELIHLDLRIKPLNAFFNLFTGKSYHVQRFISEPFRKRLKQLLQENQFDIVQFETVFMAPYVETVRQFSDAKLVLRAHNIEHLIWERTASATQNPLKKWYLGHLSRTLKQFELEVLNNFDFIAAITPADAKFFETKTTTPLKAIPFGVDLKKYQLSEKQIDTINLFHLGSMNWIPNEEGITWFLDQVWPILHENHPELVLRLAGRFMPEWLLQLQRDQIQIIGEVPDAMDFIRSNGISVVPLLSGSGIRIKIIEAMALGKAVVSTRLGAEGIQAINSKEIMIADTAEAFAEAVGQLLKDDSFRKSMEKQARIRIEQSYDNKKIVMAFVEFLGKQSSVA